MYPRIPFKSIHLPCLHLDLTMKEETPNSNHANNDQQNQDCNNEPPRLVFKMVHFYYIYQWKLIIWCSMIKRTKFNLYRYQLPLIVATLKKVSPQWVLGINIDEKLSFTSYEENITKKANKHITSFPNMHLDLAVQIYKSFI